MDATSCTRIGPTSTNPTRRRRCRRKSCCFCKQMETMAGRNATTIRSWKSWFWRGNTVGTAKRLGYARTRFLRLRHFPQGGYNVVFQPLARDRASGQCEIFADGFAGAVKSPAEAEHRPSGLAVGPHGSLYISDDIRGRIYRVTY